MTTEKALQWACSESWRVWLKVCVWRVDRDVCRMSLRETPTLSYLLFTSVLRF